MRAGRACQLFLFSDRTGFLFRIKICGITSAEDALVAADAGADAIGLNFYEPSPRCVDARIAERIAASLPTAVMKVGVFVNASADRIIELYDRLELGCIQLHGDEPAEFPAGLGGRPYIRAIRMQHDLSAAETYMKQSLDQGTPPAGMLIDAYQRGIFGGTGQVVDWQRLVQEKPVLGGIKLILAGGLNPENVADGIQSVGPDAVDVASGVESRPGVKDPSLVRLFVERAAAAFAAV